MKDERLIEKKNKSELIYDGRVLHLYRDEVILPNGNLDIREYCAHNGGVCVLPLTDEGEVICVRQYRYACEKIVIEIPAGKLEAEEWNDLRGAALRELKEETGGVKSRCIPFVEEKLSDVCACCGKPAKHMVYWAVAY